MSELSVSGESGTTNSKSQELRTNLQKGWEKPHSQLVVEDWFEPISFDDACRKATWIANSNLVPTAYKGKPQDIVVAWAKGKDLGLKPMQALQYIAVINGVAVVWGDALPALAIRSPRYEKSSQGFDYDKKCAWYKLKVKGEDEHTEYFGIDEATAEGLINKDRYKKNFKRQCEIRARSFAIRNKLPEVLLGMLIAEEVEDFDMVTLRKPEVPIDGQLTKKESDRMQNLGITLTSQGMTNEPLIDIHHEDNQEPSPEDAPVVEIELQPVDYILELVKLHDLHKDLDFFVELEGETDITQLSLEKQRKIYSDLRKLVKNKIEAQNG